MFINTTHIFNDRHFTFTYWELQLLPSRFLIRLISHYSFLQGMALTHRINKSFERTLIQYRGILSIVEEDASHETPKQALMPVRKNLAAFRALMLHLEKANYLNNKKTEKLCKAILATLYKIEGTLLRQVFEPVIFKEMSSNNFYLSPQ